MICVLIYRSKGRGWNEELNHTCANTAAACTLLMYRRHTQDYANEERECSRPLTVQYDSISPHPTSASSKPCFSISKFLFCSSVLTMCTLFLFILSRYDTTWLKLSADNYSVWLVQPHLFCFVIEWSTISHRVIRVLRWRLVFWGGGEWARPPLTLDHSP